MISQSIIIESSQKCQGFHPQLLDDFLFQEIHIIESNPQDGKNMSGLKGWRTVYLVAAGLVISSAVSFLIFGEARVQDWNYPDLNDVLEGGVDKGRKSSDQKVAVVSVKPITDSGNKC